MNSPAFPGAYSGGLEIWKPGLYPRSMYNFWSSVAHSEFADRDKTLLLMKHTDNIYVQVLESKYSLPLFYLPLTCLDITALTLYSTQQQVHRPGAQSLSFDIPRQYSDFSFNLPSGIRSDSESLFCGLFWMAILYQWVYAFFLPLLHNTHPLCLMIFLLMLCSSILILPLRLRKFHYHSQLASLNFVLRYWFS